MERGKKIPLLRTEQTILVLVELGKVSDSHQINVRKNCLNIHKTPCRSLKKFCNKQRFVIQETRQEPNVALRAKSNMEPRARSFETLFPAKCLNWF